MFFQQLQVAGLFHLLVVTVAQDDGQPGVAGLVLDTAGHVGEERVGHIEDDQPDRPASAGAELTGRLVPDEAQRLDRRLDPVTG